MSNLSATFQTLAHDFTQGVLSLLRSSSLEEIEALLSPRRGPGRPRKNGSAFLPANGSTPKTSSSSSKRLTRRSAEQIQETLKAITALVAQHKSGLRSEAIQAALGLSKKEMPKPIALGLSSGVLRKSGNKRATTYFAAKAAPDSGKSSPSSPKRASSASKKAPKAGKKKASAGKKAPKAGKKAPKAGKKAPKAGKKAPKAGKKTAPGASKKASRASKKKASEVSKKASEADKKASEAGEKAS
jgi:hypothetical protein